MADYLRWAASFVWNEWLVPGNKERSPVNSILFQPPRVPVPSHGNGTNMFQLSWEEDQEDQKQEREDSSTRSNFSSNRRGLVRNDATYAYLPPALAQVDTPHRLIVYCHGNACNIAQLIPLLTLLQQQLQHRSLAHANWHVVSVEYDGYTTNSVSNPIIANVLSSKTHRVVEHVCTNLMGLPSLGSTHRRGDSILFMGQSIGTGVVSLLVSRYYKQCQGSANGRPTLVLLSPFTSVRDLANDLFGGIGGVLIHERFDTCEALRKHLSGWRILILHGKRDALIPCSHPQRIHDACTLRNVCSLEWLEGDHYNLDWQHITRTIARELV
jgi:hypothetical protein